MDKTCAWIKRILIGGLCGVGLFLALTAAVNCVMMLGFRGGIVPEDIVFAAYSGVEFYGSYPLAVAAECFFVFLFGAVVGLATLPFAENGPSLALRSLLHFCTAAGSFALMLWGCQWGLTGREIFRLTLAECGVYLLIWLARWLYWYAELRRMRRALGLTGGKGRG